MKNKKKLWSLGVSILVVALVGFWLYGDKTVESRHIDTSVMNDHALRESLIPEGDYVVYFSWGTMPNIYAGMHMQLHDKPSILWVMRPQNFNFDYLPDHVTWIDDPDIFGIPDFGTKEFIQSIHQNYSALDQAIDRILEKNPHAIFNVYMADSEAHWMINYYFISKGVPLERLHVDFISEGSYSLNSYFDKYVWVIPGKSKIKDGLKWALRKFFIEAAFRSDKKKVKRLMEQSAKDVTKLENIGNSYTYATTLLYDSSRYWLFHEPDVFPIPYIANQLSFFPLPLSRFYGLLQPEEQKQFELLLNFDKNSFDAVLFPEGETRLPIVIIGTWAEDEDGSKLVAKTFIEDIRELIIHYPPEEYRYFFKGHPAHPDGNETEQAVMQELGFEKLPNTNFPFELLLMSYPDLIVGGYESSVFISVPPEQLQFIFGEVTAQPMLYFYENNYWPNVLSIDNNE